MKSRIQLAGVTLFVALASCSSLVIDLSPKATEAGDNTLLSSLCEATPNRGFDICYATQNTPVFSSWRLFFPAGKGINGGEVSVYFRDTQKTYPITGETVEIPFTDLFKQPSWTPDLDGEIMALATLKWVDATGIEQITLFRGLAKIVVLPPTYSRLPIDSGFVAFERDVKCKLQWTTAGRTAFTCL